MPTKMLPKTLPEKALLSPKFWPAWAVIAQMRTLALLPHSAQVKMGKTLGGTIEKVSASRRNTVDVNLQLCFPHLSASERLALRHAHFEALGQAAMEMGYCWWTEKEKLPSYTVEGREHLDAALAKGKGALLISAHFTALEIGGRLLAGEIPFDPVYRQHENAAFEWIMAKQRNDRSANAIPRGDVRSMVKALKKNHAVWFAADQAPNFDRLTAIVPFFGVPAKTVIATSRIAKMSGATVVPFFTLRNAENDGYRLIFKPALDNFPGESPEQDALRTNKIIEEQIAEAPAQYLWAHKRFKRRGEGLPDVYAR